MKKGTKIRLCKVHGRTIFHPNTQGNLICRKCAVQNTLEKRERNKKYLIEFKKGKCENCGFKNHKALTFVPYLSFDKNVNILKKNLSKHLLLCYNCVAITNHLESDKNG